MKIKSIFFPAFFAATAFVFLANCSSDKKETATSENHNAHNGHEGHDHASHSGAPEASEPQFQVAEEFQRQLAEVFSSYVDLKEALVSSDAAKAKEKASQTTQELANIDMKLVSGAAHHDWMNYHATIQSSLKEIQNTSDIEAQRKAFSILTDNLYNSIKAFGLGGEEAYYEYCPMAFNNQGGYWLSDEQQIRNPYFGDKMLTCGEVKEKLK